MRDLEGKKAPGSRPVFLFNAHLARCLGTRACDCQDVGFQEVTKLSNEDHLQLTDSKAAFFPRQVEGR